MSTENKDLELAALLAMLEDDVKIEVKQEREDNVEEEQQVDNNDTLQLPILHESVSSKVNSLLEPIPILNARGMPIRKRKRNKYYCEDDDLVDEDFKIKRPRRSSTIKKVKTIRRPLKKLTPLSQQKQNSLVTKNVDSRVFKKILPNHSYTLGIKIGTQLKNILTLPKSVRWVYCEFFYSNIDKYIFSDDNDFQVALKINNRPLTHMTRIEWNIVRRKFGKRRRCSACFFLEERKILESKRKAIRKVQELKAGDITYFKGLPSKIPMKFDVGTTVTARLRKPMNGFFQGMIEAVDVYDNTYWISFEGDVGKHYVPDYEVTSTVSPEIIINKDKHKVSGVKTEPLFKNCSPIQQNILINIVLFKQMFVAKMEQILLLKTMNEEIEKKRAWEIPISVDVKRRYAQVLMNLNSINQQMNKLSLSVQGTALDTNYLKKKCKQELIGRIQRINNEKQVVDPKHIHVLELVSDLNYLILISNRLTKLKQSTYTLLDLNNELVNLREKYVGDVELYRQFSNGVEIRLKFILMQLSQCCKPYQIKNN